MCPLTGHSNSVTLVSWSPDGKRLASGSYDNTVRIWEVATGKELSQLKAHSDVVRAVAWSPCGQWLASGGDDKMVCVYDAKTFDVKSSLNVDSSVYSVAFSPDGTTLAAGCFGQIKCCDRLPGADASQVL